MARMVAPTGSAAPPMTMPAKRAAAPSAATIGAAEPPGMCSPSGATGVTRGGRPPVRPGRGEATDRPGEPQGGQAGEAERQQADELAPVGDDDLGEQVEDRLVEGFHLEGFQLEGFHARPVRPQSFDEPAIST